MLIESKLCTTRRTWLKASLPFAMVGGTGLVSAQSAADRWDSVYREGHPRLPVEPNEFLKKVIEDQSPGDALDVGMGQGRNAVFLARAGWRVVGIDISREAVRQVNETAARERLALQAQRISLQEYQLEQPRFDLIVLMYMHNLQREDTRRMVSALRPGGRVVLEAYHADVASAGLNAITGVPRGYQETEMRQLFEGLNVQTCSRVVTKSDWSNGPDGTAPLIRYVGQRIG